MDIIYNARKEQIDGQVINYDQFLNLVLSYIVSNKLILSKSCYLLANSLSPDTTGLSISFSEDKHDDDRLKITKWINDPNFQFFVNTAAKYSFFVDKNAPWRIVADLGSPVMLEYCKTFGALNINNVFNNFYDVSHLNSWKMLYLFIGFGIIY